MHKSKISVKDKLVSFNAKNMYKGAEATKRKIAS